MKFNYEVLIVGGGPAGLSAALTLARIQRTALVCDDNRPRNYPSSHVNNFPSRDGIHPAQWRQHAKNDLEKYDTIQLFNGSVKSIQKSLTGFKAELSDGHSVSTKKIILADGIKDVFLPVPGFKELWGKAIFHCPFCHGYEARGSKMGLILKNEMAFHALPLILSLASELMVFTDGPQSFSEEQLALLKKKDIVVIEDPIEKLLYEGEELKSVLFKDGKDVARDCLFYAAPMPFEIKSNLGRELGCEINSLGLYQVNEMGATSVPGVFACGDNMSPGHSVLLACAAGTKAGFGVISELLL